MTFQDVSFSYAGSGHPVLEGAHLDIATGLLVAVTRPSGAGKSTLGKLLLRFHEPYRGRILLDGRDIAELPVEEVRHHITLLPQDSMLFDGTVRDNITFGRPDATEAEVLAAARSVNSSGLSRRPRQNRRCVTPLGLGTTSRVEPVEEFIGGLPKSQSGPVGHDAHRSAQRGPELVAARDLEVVVEARDVRSRAVSRDSGTHRHRSCHSRR
ncbi:hypothetical protein ABB07_37850 [Streptomyces incarnatus]|uniref:ABC transporter domain-containing protein n=1 Tax=Streptomyces incarnatus TaxID=665007 RepID=A0ABM5TWX7_9ACTN|nr:ABC transporter ATP-binding protein [Streptomyces incarnatus]AKJ15624.1 hypothetical protein ABB07_37850 [Streptomyces incarnatus]